MTKDTHRPTDSRIDTAALLARIDERTLHLSTAMTEVKSGILTLHDDTNGIGARIGVVETVVDNHKWLLRAIVTAIVTIITGLLLWYLTTR